MNKLLTALLAATCVATLPAAALAADAPATAKKAKKTAATVVQRDRLIVQISDADPKRWNLALNNIKNVQTGVGADKVDIELVAFGPGITLLKADSEAANRVLDAMAAGVKVVACENTLTNLKISRDDMISGIGYVPAGAVEIMRKQAEGWSYLRP